MLKEKEENPLDLLLGLLEQKKLDISNFSLAQVADGYLDYLSDFKNQDKILENISEFLWVASKLALIKSRALIFDFNLKDDFNLSENENDLKARLLEYNKFKNLSKKIEFELIQGGEFFSRKNFFSMGQKFLVDFNKEDLKNHFINLVDEYKKENTDNYKKKSLREIVKIEEKIVQIKKMLKKIKYIQFSSIVKDKTDKIEIIISFLSILELVKQGSVEVRQRSCFQEIDIVNK
jgi:segregation and condensation protein A